MNSLTVTWPRWVAALLATLTCLAAAENAKKAAPPQGDPRGSTIAFRPGQNRLNLNFTGGTVADLVALLNKLDAPGFNLMGEREDMAAPLPAFSLREVSPGAFAMALKQLLEPRGLTVMAEQNEMFVLRKTSTLRAAEPTMFESFQLAPFLGEQSIEDIVAAIRTAWELNPQNKPEALQLKFHPPTKLLLVSGTPMATMVASKVISTLAKTPEIKPTDAERRQAVADEVARRRQERDKASGHKSAAPPPASGKK